MKGRHVNFKIELEKKNEMNKELMHKCKYLEIKLEELFKCKVCNFKAIRKIDLLNQNNSMHECKQNDVKIQEHNSKIQDKNTLILEFNDLIKVQK